MSARFVDARGLRCPWPALRLARAMKEADAVEIVADDPQAAGEFDALAAAHGWSIRVRDKRFLVTAPSGGNLLTDSDP